MRLSARGRYALQAILEMSKHRVGTVLKVADIASKPQIPPDYLVQVLILLKNAGIVDSVRGKAGGYVLARPPRHISVLEVVEAVEGHSEAEVGVRPVISDALRRASEAGRKVLAETTFHELTANDRETRQEAVYSI